MNLYDLMDLPQLKEINLMIEGRWSYLKVKDPDFADDVCSISNGIDDLEAALCGAMARDPELKIHI